MFCENCGTRVDDGTPFCPNCGSKMPVPEAPAAPAAPVNPGVEANVGYVPPAAPVAAPKSADGFLGKLNAMPMMEKILFLCIGGLFVTCALFSLFRVFSYYGTPLPMESGSVFFTRVITVLFTLSITFFVLDYFDWFNLKFLWFCLAGAATTIFMLFVIIWIASGYRLSVAGWLFLLLLGGLVAANVLMVIEKLKKK